MLKITNGKDTFFVSKGAFDEIFSRQGFSVIKENKTIEEEKDNIVLLEEIPISQWNKNEVKEFAFKNNISLKGTKSIDEAKELIKEYLAM